MVVSSNLIVRRVENMPYSMFIKRLFNCDLLNGAWVAGGSVRKVWHGLPWHGEDVDFFFNSKNQFDAFTSNMSAKYDIDGVSGSTSLDFEPVPKRVPYVTCFISENANTYSITELDLLNTNVNGDPEYHGSKVQAIRRNFYPSIEALFKSFDFTACQFATDGEYMVATPEAVADCENGLMRMSADSERKVSTVRVMKYGSYGFSPVDDMMAQVLESISNGDALELPDDY